MASAPTPARVDGRADDEMRPVRLTPGVMKNAAGSCLAEFGDTRVLCSASVEEGVPGWRKGAHAGWVTAEYAMLPAAGNRRTPREYRGRKGRSMEIERLIGRSLRAVTRLDRLGEVTVTLDCDVIQADGGTRTASISGAYVAAKLAVKKLMASGDIAEDPFRDSVAAVSVGILGESKVLDLPYEEDKDADVDANIVMTGSGKFVEVQASGEEAVFGEDELAELISLARGGIAEITALQNEAISSSI